MKTSPGFAEIHSAGWRLLKHTRQNLPPVLLIMAKARELNRTTQIGDWNPRFFTHQLGGWGEALGRLPDTASTARDAFGNEVDYVARDFHLTKHFASVDYSMIQMFMAQSKQSGTTYDVLTIRHRKWGTYRKKAALFSDILTWLYGKNFRYQSIVLCYSRGSTVFTRRDFQPSI